MLDRLIRNFFQLLIRIYQMTLGLVLGGACRFEPSCSCYAIQAFNTKPWLTASSLVIQRLLKCRPFGPYGYDPVPDGMVTKERPNGEGNYAKK